MTIDTAPDASDTTWLLPTPRGALHAFSTPEPNAAQRATQALLAAPRVLTLADWRREHDHGGRMLEQLRGKQWVQLLKREVPAPDVRLGDFAQHVIAPLSGERRAVLASDSGFCLGSTGMEHDEAETLSAALADFSQFAARQTSRGWQGANHYVSFYQEPSLLLPSYSFVPLWVDGSGYWLALAGEPLLNSPVLVELLWGLKLAGTRFQV